MPTKVHLVKAMAFPEVMYGCESWTIRKAESQRIDAFELWCWRRLLRVPWTARRSNQSILKEQKLQYFGHLMRRTDSFEKTLMLGKIEGKRRRGRRRTRRLDGITDSMDMSLSKLQEMAKDSEALSASCLWDHKKSDTTGQLNNNRLGLFLAHWWLYTTETSFTRGISWEKDFLLYKRIHLK